MLMLNAEEQRFAEEKRGEQHDDSPFLCENSAVSAFRSLEMSLSPELQIQHQVFDIGHRNRILLDRF